MYGRRSVCSGTASVNATPPASSASTSLRREAGALGEHLDGVLAHRRPGPPPVARRLRQPDGMAAEDVAVGEAHRRDELEPVAVAHLRVVEHADAVEHLVGRRRPASCSRHADLGRRASRRPRADQLVELVVVRRCARPAWRTGRRAAAPPSRPAEGRPLVVVGDGDRPPTRPRRRTGSNPAAPATPAGCPSAPGCARSARGRAGTGRGSTRSSRTGRCR